MTNAYGYQQPMYQQPNPPFPEALVPATMGQRFGAYVLDVVIWGVLGAIVGAIIGGIGSASLTNAYTYGNYESAMGIATGVSVFTNLFQITIGIIQLGILAGGGTIGMRIVGLRVIRLDTLGKPGWGRAIGRNFVLGVTSLIIVGPFSPFFDKTGWNRGWHDTASNTWVIDVKRGRNPIWGAVAQPAYAQVASPVPTSAPSGLTPPPPPPVLTPPPPPPVSGGALATSEVAPLTPPPAPPVAPQAAPTWLTPTPSLSPPPAPTPPPAPPVVHDLPQEATVLRDARPVRVFGARIEFDRGASFVVDRGALIGRNPSAKAGDAASQLIAVDDDTRAISKTHAEIGVDDGRVWIIDRASTNGTYVLEADGTRTDATPGTRVDVPVGAKVYLGTRFFELVSAGLR